MAAGIGRSTQSTIYRAGASGTRPAVPARWSELVAAAERAMSADAWAYIAGSSGREGTADANAAAFDRRPIRRGVDDLLETQAADGSWNEPPVTGTGFPRVFYLRYDMYRNNWTLLALAAYRKALLRR